MTKPMVYIFDMATQEETIREMNDAEYEQHLIDEADTKEQVAKQAEENVKIVAKKAAKKQALAALGLSQEIVNLLAE
jgi:NACalpha-BTF3-like transcription factor